MKCTPAKPRFDPDTLRRLAGEKVFARGQTYLDQVQILSIEPSRVLAQVAGTEDYRIVLTGGGKQIGGECSCPAFTDFGFCKHMVATGLAANQADAGTGALARVRAHLKQRGTNALVEMIVGLAERDPALFRRLDRQAATSGSDDKAAEAGLRRAIDGATRKGRFIDYDEAPGWAAAFAPLLDEVAELASGGRAAAAARLAERAIERLEQSLETMDDSDGCCGRLLDRAVDVHVAACGKLRPDSIRLASDLYAREMNDPYGVFGGAARRYEDVLGTAGLAEYRRLATDAWDKLPVLTPRKRRENDVSYASLRSVLDYFAERDGDVDSRIILRAKDLSSVVCYRQVAEFCREQGRDADALRYAEEGLWVFADEVADKGLLALAADLLTQAGRTQDAEAHLWRAFERTPSLDLYARLRSSGGMPAGRRVVAFLQARLGKQRPTQWHNPADLLVRVLTAEQDFAAAWTLARKYAVSTEMCEALARVSEATHPHEAVRTYTERVKQLASLGGNQNYEAAASLVARMGTLRDAAAQAVYLAEIRVRFRPKRNLMKLLGQ